jgi:hypothetical protein
MPTPIPHFQLGQRRLTKKEIKPTEDPNSYTKESLPHHSNNQNSGTTTQFLLKESKNSAKTTKQSTVDNRDNVGKRDNSKKTLK